MNAKQSEPRRTQSQRKKATRANSKSADLHANLGRVLSLLGEDLRRDPVLALQLYFASLPSLEAAMMRTIS